MMYFPHAAGLAYFNSGVRVMNYSVHRAEAVSCSKLLVVSYQTTQHAGSEDCKRQRFLSCFLGADSHMLT
jgi:hypothetical protein